MIKVLTFLEADLSRIELTLNPYLGAYDILYVWNTSSRLVFILKEKGKRGRRKGVKEAPVSDATI